MSDPFVLVRDWCQRRVVVKISLWLFAILASARARPGPKATRVSDVVIIPSRDITDALTAGLSVLRCSYEAIVLIKWWRRNRREARSSLPKGKSYLSVG